MFVKNIIVNDSVFNQDNFSKDGKYMLRSAFHSFLDDLIRDNAKHRNDGFELFACDLNDADKKIFLTYLVEPEYFEECIQNKVRIQELFNEFESEMQYLIDDRCGILYHRDMQEMGHVLCHHKDNGESYYR